MQMHRNGGLASEQRRPPLGAEMAAASMSMCLTSILFNPMDVVKVRLQVCCCVDLCTRLLRPLSLSTSLPWREL